MNEQDVYAYVLDTYNIQECYELQESVIVYDSGRKGYEKRVKEKLWRIVEEMELRHDWDNRWINFDDIQFHRAKLRDKRMYKGLFISRGKYKGILLKIKHNKAIQAIMENEDVTHCYIMKRGSYYCDNYCGYTSNVSRAGVYLKSDAVYHAKGILEISVIPINTEEHNRMLKEEIKQLKSHLIH